MNAKDRLRLYLEQRRELGESELVLDALPVDDVLRMIGAPMKKSVSITDTADAVRTETPAATKTPTAIASDDESLAVDGVAATDAAPPLPQPLPAARFDADAPTDWRSALKALAPDTPTTRQSAAVSASSASSPQSSEAANKTQAEVSAVNPLPAASTAFPTWLVNLGVPTGLSASALTGSATTEAAVASLGSLADVAGVIAACRACSLGAAAINPVPGEGNSTADFVCVGEAPGQTEDETGRPFVGAAGQLLTKILAAIQLQREDIFICNVLKHRPPGNRNPLPDEIHACAPYLTRQLALLQPKVILALGTFASHTLLNTTTSLGKLRGQVHQYAGIPLIVTYHPSALLRNESWKRPTWDDVKLARRVLDAARTAVAS